MQATRALIQIFLPRLALRRRRAPAARLAVAASSQLAHAQTRLSRACDCPELRGPRRRDSELETLAPFARHAVAEETSAHLIAFDSCSSLLVLMPAGAGEDQA